MTTHKLVMKATGLVKRYGQVTALDGADFELRAGEILAVIGDNGAGKSSLIKALSGATIPDQGTIELDGKIIHFKSPIDARRVGIAQRAFAQKKSACAVRERHGHEGNPVVGHNGCKQIAQVGVCALRVRVQRGAGLVGAIAGVTACRLHGALQRPAHVGALVADEQHFLESAAL